MKTFLYNRNTSRIYEVVGVDKTAGTITLKNEMAAFTDNYDKDKFKQQGYMAVQGEDEDAARATAISKIEAEAEAA